MEVTFTITAAQAALMERRFGEPAADYISRTAKRIVEQVALDYRAEMERVHFRRFESDEDLAAFLADQ